MTLASEMDTIVISKPSSKRRSRIKTEAAQLQVAENGENSIRRTTNNSVRHAPDNLIKRSPAPEARVRVLS